MEFDPEIKAMNDVYAALKDLEDAARKRIIEWVSERFSLTKSKTKEDLKIKESSEMPMNEIKLSSFPSVAEVFAKTNPKKEPEKVLIVGAYLQEVKGTSELTGREINKELNHLGHGVGNITVAITSLINKRPQLMIQTRKEGTTQQAQKKYKVTTEGFAVAKKMIAATSNNQE
jgi:hypothetical protein